MDKRLQLLSYSTMLKLHECPRAFQLYKLKAQRTENSEFASVTFAFGHCVGLGIQLTMDGASEEKILWEMYKFWNPDLFAANEKSGKSFWEAVVAVQKLLAMRSAGYLKDYELLEYNGKPAAELSFQVLLPGGFKYRGHVDAVLRHKITGEIVVLEVKTTSSRTVPAARYQNSAQAIGYSVVLDTVAPDVSSYKVIYLIYKSKDREFEQMEFSKSYLQRALWIQELLLDTQMITLYENIGVYPMHGEACEGKYYSECEYIQTCTMSTQYLASPEPSEEELDLDKETGLPMVYQINLTLLDLINSQLAKEI